MASPKSLLHRRELMAGLGAAALSLAMPRITAAQGRPILRLEAKPDLLALRPGQSRTAVWSLLTFMPGPGVHFSRGDQLAITLGNELPVPALFNWHGLNGSPGSEPLVARAAVPSGAKETLTVPLRHAGTFLCDTRLLGDGQSRPSPMRALLVSESERVAVDRDEVFLVEDWRLRPDGSAIAPGIDPKDASPVFTVDRRLSLDITARTNERIRIRFINGCQRSVIAAKIENFDVRVMAIDGQPAEPFLARNGALVLPPGGRVDAFVDVTAPAGASSSILVHDGKEARPIGRLIVSSEPPVRAAPLPPAPPLPSNGLPARLDLKGATRAELTLGGPQGDWVPPATFAPTAAPAFRTKAGRTVVLALTNRGTIANAFHLHGHHFRLLDRLDDGWKPFWLDTLAIEPGRTERIAFLAEFPGRYLMESVATDWAAPRLVRWYSVD